MYPFDPHTYLFIADQDRDRNLLLAERRRLAAAQKRLRRDELRVQRAWDELTASLADVSASERRVLELARR
ncbi:hypothetical protein CH306_08005 [Rhodococcus sp. 15-725-2-2b]|jgi:hypothetical protein|uniref:hypothetical protein n=1 Tax=Nocardiaceae TaxID=85025 RepID=UPI00050C0E68|nr:MULTISPECIES: hypothetical protein [Rhodococcus]OZC69413.1 hypothetical protein CH277_09790 [Rhodococcus sp. 06-469-3-2]OZC85739.1 hypothetical protein CH274_02465 [Rhodococcus sp. 06-418-5]OZD45575.1 hypothetical protein CH264_14855 [Rhodococcus sp. 06-1477-1A]OZD79754.1 hypothetical protein CH273_16560 [Rhodococcus sp. 05-339-2]OZE75583.1 hypothetical protein CH306_08005 [Rhodococcus sp. 15-725-2-2b]